MSLWHPSQGLEESCLVSRQGLWPQLDRSLCLLPPPHPTSSTSSTFSCFSLIRTLTWHDVYGLAPGGSAVENPPAMQKMWETQVLSLDQEGPLDEEMATCSSILV